MNLTHRRPYRPTPDERRSLRRNQGIPSCPDCEMEDVDSPMAKLAMTDGEEIGPNYRSVRRTCRICSKTWNVEFRTDGDRPRVVGYSAWTETTEFEGGPTMSSMKKTATQKRINREVAKAEKAPGTGKAKRRPVTEPTPDGTPVESTIDAMLNERGIHPQPLTAPARTEKAKPPRDEAAVERPDDDSGSLVVFAFRLTRSERDLIHSAAGPAKASRFVKGLAVAAALGDGDALQRILEECGPVKS